MVNILQTTNDTLQISKKPARVIVQAIKVEESYEIETHSEIVGITGEARKEREKEELRK